MRADRESAGQVDESRRTLLAEVLQMAAHLVGETLGIRSLSPQTLYAGFMTVLVGLPLVSAAVQTVVDGILLWSLGRVPPVVLSAAVTGTLLLVVLSLWGWTAVRLRADLRYQDYLAQLRGGPGEPDQRALLFACSKAMPPEWIRELAAMPAERRIAAANSDRQPAARWLGLLISSLTYHGPFLERLVLLVDPQTAVPDAREALRQLVQRVVEQSGTRDLGPLGHLEFLDMRDPHDAEDVRALVGGKLAELEELVEGSDRVAVQITGGTAAMSVGLVLAASLHGVEVLYYRQDQPDPLVPVHVETDRARRKMQELAERWKRRR